MRELAAHELKKATLCALCWNYMYQRLGTEGSRELWTTKNGSIYGTQQTVAAW